MGLKWKSIFKFFLFQKWSMLIDNSESSPLFDVTAKTLRRSVRVFVGNNLLLLFLSVGFLLSRTFQAFQVLKGSGRSSQFKKWNELTRSKRISQDARLVQFSGWFQARHSIELKAFRCKIEIVTKLWKNAVTDGLLAPVSADFDQEDHSLAIF